MARCGGGWFAALDVLSSNSGANLCSITAICIPCCSLPKTCLLAEVTIC